MKLRLILACSLVIAAGNLGAAIDLTAYSTTKPIKIMPVGDSITDDCEINGAWRQYLQPLLDSGGIPFTFVGRQFSGRTATFTKIYHEGYCGTVIAPPGVFAAHQYPTTQCYLEKIVPDAFINAKPDLILILIGANDIGRGRDPRHVATNDVPALLNIIFSNLPNTYVILDKPTTMRDATISANNTNYGVFASNVPTYSAALQELVNERQAVGQNVYLADMFSVVDYSTGFMGDHLHPDAAGLKAVAQEWFTRIQTILTGTNLVTRSLIHGGHQWRYDDSGADLDTNWAQAGFDDGAWNAGYGRFGYGDSTDQSVVNTNTTVYFRTTFVVGWNEVFTNLDFRLSQTGGAVVYLNGRELYRTNLPAGPVSYATLATTSLTGDAANIYYQTKIIGTNLVMGTNTLAVEVHQSNPANAAFGFDMEVLGGAFLLAPPALAASVSQSNIDLTWPADSGRSFGLYSTTDLASGSWSPVYGALQTNQNQISLAIPPGAGSVFFQLRLSQ